MNAAKIVPLSAGERVNALAMLRQSCEQSLALVHALQAMLDREEGWEDRSESKLLELAEHVIDEAFGSLKRLEGDAS